MYGRMYVAIYFILHDEKWQIFKCCDLEIIDWILSVKTLNAISLTRFHHEPQDT